MNSNSANQSADAALNPIDVIQALRRHVRWWAAPAVAGALLAMVYSLVAASDWRATQALIIRPEAASVSEERLGKFADLSEMKTLQETILELAKSNGVLQATLREVGPPTRYRRPAQWPTALDIEDFRECVDMRPPGGAEFGKTEVFYLSVRNTDRARASALVAALCRQLEERMQEIRDQRAQGMITELERTVAMADSDLATQTSRLSTFETKIGADLAELRNLNAEIGGQTGLSQELQTIDTERRANEAKHSENVRLLKLLIAAQQDTDQLLATPSSLLNAQPGVNQLKNALVAAQVNTATLLGGMSEKHPLVIAARESEELIREQLHAEIAVAIRGLEVDIELGAERDAALAAKSETTRGRLARLAEARAEYANLTASVANHTRLLEAARKNLADARARQAGARSASVISRIDGVDAGVRPVGPGRKVITAAGGFGGLIVGLGVVFLFGMPGSSGIFIAKEPASQPPQHVRPVAPANYPGSPKRESSIPIKLSPSAEFGMFQGMTLEQALKSVERHAIRE